jgi:hypothetical protein
VSLHRWHILLLASLAWCVLAFAQAPFSWGTTAQPPVPTDPLEIASGNAQPLQDAAQRAVAANLLDTARALFNLRDGPYDLKMRFTSTGSSSLDGSWQLQDMSPGRNIYRWTARGPVYSAVNLFLKRVLYSNLPASDVPLRLAPVPGAVWTNYPIYGPLKSIRTVSGN